MRLDEIWPPDGSSANWNSINAFRSRVRPKIMKYLDSVREWGTKYEILCPRCLTNGPQMVQNLIPNGLQMFEKWKEKEKEKVQIPIQFVCSRSREPDPKRVQNSVLTVENFPNRFIPQTDLSVGVLTVLIIAPINHLPTRWCCRSSFFIDFYDTNSTSPSKTLCF